MQVSNHPISAEELMAYLDGELPAGRSAEAEKHLALCRQCQAVAADFQSVSRRLAEWEVRFENDGLPAEVRRALEYRTERTRNRGAFRVQAWMWACAPLVLVAILLPMWQHRRDISSLDNLDQNGRLAAATAIAPHALRADRFSAVANGADRQAGSAGFLAADGTAVPDKLPATTPTGPLIVRTAEFTLTANDFPSVRDRINQLLAARQGYVADLQVSTPADAPRSLTANLRVPAAQLDGFLLDLKQLGRVRNESQRGEDVTQQVVDVDARLNNLRTTEARLIEILRTRTGKLADVLQVEEQIDRTRGEIETAEAEQKSLARRIAFATVHLEVNELFKASLRVDHAPVLTRLRNAVVAGIDTLGGGVLSVLLWLLSAGPSLLVLAAVLFWPVRVLWKRTRSLR